MNRFTRTGEGECGFVLNRCAGERMALRAEIAEIGKAEGAAHFALLRNGFPESDEAGGVRVGKGAKEHCVHNAEDGGIGADADGQGEYGDEGEAGVFEHSADGLSNVLSEGIHTHLPVNRGTERHVGCQLQLRNSMGQN